MKWDENGLVVAIAQDRLTGRVQMVAWMNAEALATTLRTRLATFYSRSRKQLWTKGETSGHRLEIHSVHLDCDGDSILLMTRPIGPSCHTGEETCFFRALSLDEAEGDGSTQLEPTRPAAPVLVELEAEIRARKESPSAARSYTRTLFEGGAPLVSAKLREEADELARAVSSEDPSRVSAEAADVVYHLLVALASRDVPFADVLAELARRRGTSGLDEKAARTKK